MRAVQAFNLDVNDRELMVIVGPSGCGKSSTLRMVAGLEEISRGDIYMSGRRINQVSPTDRNVAMVFQNYALYPHMTVYRNMAFGLKQRNLSKTDIQTCIYHTAQLLDITHCLDHKPSALSGGERQRVALGRALVQQPSVFLLDEPLSNLDAKMRIQLRTEISKLHTRLQSTMIYVTHDQTEAMSLGDRICVMEKGIIQQVDTPLAIYRKPANQFVAGFIGAPSMNFLNGTIEDHGNHLCFLTDDFDIPLESNSSAHLNKYKGQRILLGIRSEHITINLWKKGEQTNRRIRASIEAIEPTGPEMHLHLNTGTQSIIARVDAHYQSRIDQDVDVCIDAGRVLFFDPKTKRSISA